MEKLARLFGRSIRFAYHGFDRIVIRGYLSALSRPENIEYFFRTIKQVECIGKETLRQRTDQYLSWVKAYSGNHQIPIEWAQKDVRKLRAHGLIERPGNRYVYALADYGRKAAAMLVIVRNRILRPIAGSLFERPPKSSLKPNSKLQAQYRRTTRSFNDLIALLNAA